MSPPVTDVVVELLQDRRPVMGTAGAAAWWGEVGEGVAERLHVHPARSDPDTRLIRPDAALTPTGAGPRPSASTNAKERRRRAAEELSDPRR